MIVAAIWLAVSSARIERVKPIPQLLVGWNSLVLFGLEEFLTYE
jgi:hypothetical protein